MNALLEFAPLVAFFFAYKMADIYIATAVLVGASALALGFKKLLKMEITTANWVTLGVLTLFGGLTILLHDEVFIKLKPTVVYWVLAAVLVGGLWRNINLLEKMLGMHLKAPAKVWRQLDAAWALFFFVSGIINLAVAYGFSTDIWVKFKIFAMPILTILFTIIISFKVIRAGAHQNQA